MQKYITIAVVLFATVALGQCNGYGSYGGSEKWSSDKWSSSGPSYDDQSSVISGKGGYGSGGPSLGPVQVYGPGPAYAPSGAGSGSGYGSGSSNGYDNYNAGPSSYAPALGWAPASGPSSYGSSIGRSAISSAPSGGYGGPSGAYGGPSGAYGSQSGYGSRSGYSNKPIVSIAPVISSEVYPGRNNYRVYPQAPQYNKAILPVIAASPVAKVYKPRGGYSQSGYGQGGAY